MTEMETWGCEFSVFRIVIVKGMARIRHRRQRNVYNWGKNHQIRYWELLKEPAPGRRQRVGNEAGLTPAHSREILKASFASIKAVAPDVKVFSLVWDRLIIRDILRILTLKR